MRLKGSAVDELKVIIRGRSKDQRAKSTRRAAHSYHPQVEQDPRPVQLRDGIAHEGQYVQNPGRGAASRVNGSNNGPRGASAGESSSLHRRGGVEGDYRFVKNEFTVESNVIIGGVYERGHNRVNDNSGVGN